MSKQFVCFSELNTIGPAMCSIKNLITCFNENKDKTVTSASFNKMHNKMEFTFCDKSSTQKELVVNQLQKENEIVIAIDHLTPSTGEDISNSFRKLYNSLSQIRMKHRQTTIKELSISKEMLSIILTVPREQQISSDKTDGPEVKSDKHLLLIDGNNLFNKCFFVTCNGKEPEEIEKDEQGKYIETVKLFINQLGHLFKKYNPTHVSVAFDTSKNAEKTWRKRLYTDYKGTREEKPNEHVFVEQIQTAREILKQMRIPQHADESGEYEADDLIATFHKARKDYGIKKCTIFSSDKDLHALLDDDTVQVFKRGKKQVDYTRTDFINEYQLEPEQVPDLKGLVGDKSDNIKGVPGVGDKISEVLREFGTINGIYTNIDNLNSFEGGKYKRYIKKLTDGKEDAALSLKIATLVQDVPFLQTINMDNELLLNIDQEGSKKAFERLGY